MQIVMIRPVDDYAKSFFPFAMDVEMGVIKNQLNLFMAKRDRHFQDQTKISFLQHIWDAACRWSYKFI